LLKVAIVFGTRPEVIKLAPVYAALRRRADKFSVKIISSGQHRDLVTQMVAVFDIPVDVDLAVMRPGQTLSGLTASILAGLEPIFEEDRPDVVLVQGDTTTVLAGAVAAFYQRVTVGHVEAGLRTCDKRQPFPEEINRRLTDAVADLHFAATEKARENLLLERVPPNGIFVTGNTVADALQMVLARRPTLEGTELAWVQEWKGRVLLVTAHRRENWGVPMASICRALRRLHDAFDDLLIVFPAHPNPTVRETVYALLQAAERVRIIEPPAYSLFVPLLRRADLIITDSGGIQEEAPSLGIPVLVARETTERPEGVEAGSALLVGTDEERITAHATRLLSDPRAYQAMAAVHNPYGDGRAAERIADAIEFWFGLRAEPPEPFHYQANSAL
jgi:UDP-N-acetylglucosamine 2-epimerase (non-hydrolysing)